MRVGASHSDDLYTCFTLKACVSPPLWIHNDLDMQMRDAAVVCSGELYCLLVPLAPTLFHTSPNASTTAPQACHDLVPPDELAPIVRAIANNFVSDRCGAEVIQARRRGAGARAGRAHSPSSLPRRSA